MKVVITGAAGFIGTNLLNYYKGKADIVGVAAIDKLGYGAGQKPDVPFLYTNLQNLSDFPGVFDGVDVVVNLAAETHVDRSIGNYWKFFESNVRGTASLLDAIANSGNKDLTLVHVSTDEVFGPVPNREPHWAPFSGFTEDSLLDPHNPYSGTKAAAEMLIRAWTHQEQRRTVICRLCNVFGPYQYPEKFIPKAVIRTLQGESVPMYGDGSQIREWLYVDDACSAIDACLISTQTQAKGMVDSFNFSSGWETDNKGVLGCIADSLYFLTGKLMKVESVPDRPGHDNGYKMSSRKARQTLWWGPKLDLTQRIFDTVHWFVNHQDWSEAIVTKNPKLLSKQPWLEQWK